jgi:hypothetical protein
MEVMQHSPDENDAAIERELASLRFLKPDQRPVMKAYLQFHAGVPIDQQCPSCGGSIAVESPGPEVWITRCHCGKCNSSFKGL